MKNNGRDVVYMTGSRVRVWRCIYEQDGRFFIKWHGEFVEVRRGNWGAWCTVGQY